MNAIGVAAAAATSASVVTINESKAWNLRELPSRTTKASEDNDTANVSLSSFIYLFIHSFFFVRDPVIIRWPNALAI